MAERQIHLVFLRLAAVLTILAAGTLLSAESLTPSAARPAESCELSKLDFQAEGPKAQPLYTSHLPHYDVEVIVPYAMEHPNLHEALWEGHLKIKRKETGAVCQETEGAMDEVYASGARERLVSLSHSGSMTYLHFIDLKTCRTLQTLKVFTEGIRVQGSRLEVLPGCESAKAERESVCAPAQVLALDAECRPQRREKESFELTKKLLGVGFTGAERTILNPKTDHAVLRR